MTRKFRCAPMDQKTSSSTDSAPDQAAEPDADAQTGIPDGVAEAEPVGLPTSDRHQGETAPTKP